MLLKQGDSENETIANIYVKALERLGITPTVTVIDTAQYKERTNAYEFDMAYYWRGLSLSPGNEQYLYWGADGIETPGTRNWMGMNSPAAEAMIDQLVNSQSQADFLAAGQALDRVLTSGRYVIPFHGFYECRMAHRAEFNFPDRTQMYGDYLDFHPFTWWYEE